MSDDPSERLLTRDEAAAAAHVSVKTVDTWVLRSQLQPAAAGPLYREIDVLRTEARTRRAPRLRRLLAQAVSLKHHSGQQESVHDAP